MGRRAVEVEIILFDILAVVPFAVGKSEETLLQNRVLAVPQRERKAEPLLVVREPCEPVFAPAVGAGPRLVMGKVSPGVAVVAVVLPHGSPLPLAQVRAPFPPRSVLFTGFGQAFVLVRLHGIHGVLLIS